MFHREKILTFRNRRLSTRRRNRESVPWRIVTQLIPDVATIANLRGLLARTLSVADPNAVESPTVKDGGAELDCGESH